MDIFFIVIVEKEWLANQELHLDARLCAGTGRRFRSRATKGERPDTPQFASCNQRNNGMIGFKHSI